MICPVCSLPETTVFLRRPSVPVHQNLLYGSAPAARDARRGDLEMAVCGGCGFVFNAAFDESLLEYGEDYENTQCCSPYFASYVDGLVDHIVDGRGIRGRTIVEVGCGKGHFLRKLVEADPENRGIGFDPSYLGDLTQLDGRLRFERRFYQAGAHVEPDAVVCRHVIEHVADPGAMLASIHAALNGALDGSKDGSTTVQLFFETPDVEWIVRNEVIWDFFYEHCSLFTAGSLSAAFERNGFEVREVRKVFEEQYLWLEAVPAAEPLQVARAVDTAPYFAFAERERVLLELWRTRIDALRAEGPVAIWGAGAKGITFANLLDPDCSRLACVVDLNPAKHGRFVAGTGHAIVDWRTLAELGVRNVFLMNPNYEAETRAILAAAGLDVNLLPR